MLRISSADLKSCSISCRIALSGQGLHACRALTTLAGHLRAWGLAGMQLTVDPLLRPHAECFYGIAYQIHVVTRGTGATHLVAIGASLSLSLPSLAFPWLHSFTDCMSYQLWGVGHMQCLPAEPDEPSHHAQQVGAGTAC